MKYYVFENGFDVEVFNSLESAIDSYETILDRMTDTEKDNVEYFRLYEVSQNPDCYDGDLIDIMVGNYIKCLR